MTTVKELAWEVESMMDREDTMYRAHAPEIGRFTVLDRMTGFGHRDIETGFKDLNGKFWLASGDFDVRDHPDLTFQEAADLVKKNANNCVGV